MTLRTLNYENYGIFLIMCNAGFCPSTVPLWNCVPKTIIGVVCWDLNLIMIVGVFYLSNQNRVAVGGVLYRFHYKE